MDEQQKLANSKEVLAFLATEFPKCFSLQSDAKPLKIGIFHDLSEHLKDDTRLSKRLLRMSLRHYTSSWKYLASVKEGAHRIDLNGVDDVFSIKVEGKEQLKVNKEGIIQFTSQSVTPSAVAGGLFYSASNDYYFGYSN